MTADALRWHVLLRKLTIVERRDCERLPAKSGTRTSAQRIYSDTPDCTL